MARKAVKKVAAKKVAPVRGGRQSAQRRPRDEEHEEREEGEEAEETEEAAPRGKKTPGKSMQKWDKEMARLAELSQTTIDSIGSGGRRAISTRSGTFTIEDVDIGTELEGVIIAYTLENAFYNDGYDPDNPSIPVCFAFGPEGMKEQDMAPKPEDVEDLQNDDCKTCWANEWASGDKGRGKACKNQAKLLIIRDTELEDVASADPYVVNVSVTSRGNLKGYVKSLDEKLHRHPIGVVTRLTLKPHKKHQFEMHFLMVGEIEGDVIGELLELREQVSGDLTRPYQRIEEDGSGDDKPTSRKKKPAGSRPTGNRPPSRGAAARRKPPQRPAGRQAGRRP